jgi:ubiquinone biosynthesis protein
VTQLSAGQSVQPLILRRKLQLLGPPFVTRAQFLALRVDHVGAAHSAELLGLKDRWEQLPPETVKATVERQLEGPLESAFASFEWTPFESRMASQSHRAELWDGSSVEVKVRRPDYRRQVQGPRSAERTFWKLLRAATQNEEIERVLDLPLQEWLDVQADFSAELRNLVRLRDLSEPGDPAYMAKPFAELCGEDLLVLELVDGVPILDIAPLRLAGESRSATDGPQNRAAAQNIYLATLSQVLVNGFAVANIHPDNVWLLSDSRISYRSAAFCREVPGMSGRDEVQFLSAAHGGSLVDIVDASRRLVVGRAGEDFAGVVRAFTTDVRARLFPLTDPSLRAEGDSVDGAAVLLELVRAAEESGVRFPSNVDLAQRLLVASGCAARRISVDLDFRTASRYLNAVSRDDDRLDLDPDRLEQNLLRMLSLMSTAPRHIERLLSELGDGSLILGVTAQESEKHRVDHNRRTRLLALSILTVGVTVLAVAAPASSSLAAIPDAVFVIVLSLMYAAVLVSWWRMR